MVQIYLSGPINEGENPHEWRDEIVQEWPEIDWINPFKLHNIPNDELRERVQEVIDIDLRKIKESDAVLLRRIHNYNLSGASIEAREAFINEVPVIVWNTEKTEIPLFLYGHVSEVYTDRDEAIEAAINAASE